MNKKENFYRNNIASRLLNIPSEKIEEDVIYHVSQAIRLNFGHIKVKGTIISLTKLFKMISKIEFYCDQCQKLNELEFEYPLINLSKIVIGTMKCPRCNIQPKNLNEVYKNAIIIELQDIEKFNDFDRLFVYLFDEDTKDIQIGETVIITGNIHINSNNNNKNQRYFPYLYAESIKYQNREDFTLTNLDIEAIKKFASNNFNKKYQESSVIDKLISLFDLSIVGYNHVKKGLLITAVSTSEDISRNRRLNALLIGEPGLAKSKLARRITQLVPNSRFESGQNSSGKSLTAIVEKTNDTTLLRLGVVPQAKGAICAINEIGRQSMEDQGHLLDVMEEGLFTFNKHGMNAKINSPTTIVATANPINNSKWIDNEMIDLNEFPMLEPLKDRFDLKFIFSDKRKNDKDIRDFVKKLADIEGTIDNTKLPDYTSFLIKYIQYAKNIQPKISEEANIMLQEYCIEVKKKRFGSDRIIKTILKIAKAIAKLKLKEIVDEEDAKEAMQFYNVILSDFQKSVIVSQSPRDLAFKECTIILEELKDFGGITVEDLIKKICERNEQLSNYFGYGKKSLKIRNNKKVNNIYEMLLNHSKIKKIQEKPIALRWISDSCDSCDLSSFSSFDSKEKLNNSIKSTPDTVDYDHNYSFKNKEIETQTSEGNLQSESHRSHVSLNKPLECNWCTQKSNTVEEHLKHSTNTHRGKPAQPNKEMILQLQNNGYKIEFKGNQWEI